MSNNEDSGMIQKLISDGVAIFATLEDVLSVEECKELDIEGIKFNTEEDLKAKAYFWKCVEENRPFDYKWKNEQ